MLSPIFSGREQGPEVAPYDPSGKANLSFLKPTCIAYIAACNPPNRRSCAECCGIGEVRMASSGKGLFWTLKTGTATALVGSVAA